SSRRRHTRFSRDWSSDVCSSDLDKTVRGRFVWHELITPDTAGAHAFYTKVLGWRTQAWDLNPDYTMFVAPSGPLGGSVGRPSERSEERRVGKACSPQEQPTGRQA